MPGARLWIALCCIAALGACDVSSGGPPGKAFPPGVTSTPTPTPSPAPTPSPPQARPTLIPAMLSFAAPNAPAQTVAVSESGYSGTFSVDGSSCAGIATIALSTDSRTLTVTPSAAGSCTAVVHDTLGGSANLPIAISP